VDDHLLQLLKTLQEDESPFTYIIHAYVESMRAYQSVYFKPYDVSVLAFKTVNDSSCIKLLKSGIGFLRRVPEMPVQQNGWERVISKFRSGKRWESIFLNGFEDMWVTYSCNTPSHRRYVSAQNLLLVYLCF